MRAFLILSDAAADSSVCVWNTFHVCVVIRPDGTPSNVCPRAELAPCDHEECRAGRVVLVELPPALEAELRALARHALASERR